MKTWDDDAYVYMKCLHTYINAYIHAYIHTCIPEMLTYIRIRSSVCECTAYLVGSLCVYMYICMYLYWFENHQYTHLGSLYVCMYLCMYVSWTDHMKWSHRMTMRMKCFVLYAIYSMLAGEFMDCTDPKRVVSLLYVCMCVCTYVCLHKRSKNGMAMRMKYFLLYAICHACTRI